MELQTESRCVSVLYVGASRSRERALRDALSADCVEVSVVAAATGAEAADVADNRHLTAIVVENDLQDGDGLDALERCLAVQPKALAVVLATDPTPETVDRAYEAGADEFVHGTDATSLRVVANRLESYVDDATRASALDDEIGADEASAPDDGEGPEGASASGVRGEMEPVAESMSEVVLSVDESGVVRYANPAIESVLGYDPAAVVGDPVETLLSDDVADRYRERVQRSLQSGDRALDRDGIELRAEHADGSDVPVSASFSKFALDGTRYVTGILRDVSDRKRLEAERELYHDTTQRVLRADSFADGLQNAVHAIGSSMNWQYGEAWTPTEDGVLERVPEPYVASGGADDFALESASWTFESGEGLVGRVWESGSYEWMADVTAPDAEFRRADAADRVGFRSALAVPISSDGTSVAVMTFLLPDRRQTDEEMIEATRIIAADLGHLLNRLRAESMVREERSLKDRILETSPVGILIVDDDDTFRYLNERAAELIEVDADEGPVATEDMDIEHMSFEGEHAPDPELFHRRVIDGEAEVSGEARIVIDGEPKWIHLHAAPLRGTDGAVTAAVCSLWETTEQRERERRLLQYAAVMETVGDGAYALDEDGRFALVNDAYTDLLGYDRDTLLGEPAARFVGEQTTEEASAVQAGDGSEGAESATVEAVLETGDGGEVPVEARISSFEFSDGELGRAGVVRDISDRKRREERLAQLNELGQSLTAAQTPGAVANVVVEGARELLDLPVTAVRYYDEAEGELDGGRRVVDLDDAHADQPVFDADSTVHWEVFASNDERIVSDVAAAPGIDAEETPLGSAALFPIGTHGVFLAGATTPNAFDDADLRIARILVANALAALDRVDREQELHEKKAQLEANNESLERVNRLNSVIRNLTQELTDASTRDGIETAVCEELVGTDPYVFAWIGTHRSVDDEIRPRASAGRDDGYLDTITVTATEDDTAEGPAGRAVRTLEPAVQNNLQADPPFEPWRTQALQRDYRSSIAVPLVYRDTLYGVLNIYADAVGVFDDLEVAVLRELGEMIGYAINAIERKKALVSDAAVELTFDLDDRTLPALRFTAETGGTFEFETFVEQSDGTIRVFFRIRDAEPDVVQAFCDRSTTIEDVTLLAETEDGHRYEAVVSDDGFLGQLVSYGAHPTAMTATADGGRVTVEFPRSGDVKSFVRMFVRTYDGAELRNRTEYDRPVKTREAFEANYRQRLTERQEEVLKTAYFSGFFEWPRETSGTDLASKLDVSQPTVSRHIRKGERKLFELVFEDQ